MLYKSGVRFVNGLNFKCIVIYYNRNGFMGVGHMHPDPSSEMTVKSVHLDSVRFGTAATIIGRIPVYYNCDLRHMLLTDGLSHVWSRPGQIMDRIWVGTTGPWHNEQMWKPQTVDQVRLSDCDPWDFFTQTWWLGHIKGCSRTVVSDILAYSNTPRFYWFLLAYYTGVGTWLFLVHLSFS